MNGRPVSRFDYKTGATVIANSPLEVQLVRDGRPLSPGSLAGQQNGNPGYFGLCLPYVWANPGQACLFGHPGFAIVLKATIRLINGTCSTPDQSVTLPPMVVHKLKGVGSTGDMSGTKGFELRFNNCPPGFARIGYVLSPTAGTAPAFAGALPVDGGTTAKGVAIQITGKDGAPATFNQRLPLAAYSSSTGGSYSVPMNARYIQTEATVTPGTISGMMSVLVDYQ
ncbi:Putative fimbrial component [Cupriavidus basilensis]|uniref:Putative fimbrial component n=2 Tax=Cupriavidus basilensis TaxID=68895 RepID=A0A0C4Y8P0_9BURK|nr:Putative fimbrial component [Cupriavidus basilensis]